MQVWNGQIPNLDEGLWENNPFTHSKLIIYRKWLKNIDKISILPALLSLHYQHLLQFVATRAYFVETILGINHATVTEVEKLCRL